MANGEWRTGHSFSGIDLIIRRANREPPRQAGVLTIRYSPLTIRRTKK
jgi:hypothetical protein